MLPVVLAGTVIGLVGWLMRNEPVNQLTRYWPWLITVGAGVVLLSIVVLIRQRAMLRVLLIGLAGLTFGIFFATAVPATTPGQGDWAPAMIGGGVLTALALGVWWRQHGGSAGTVLRWARRSRRHDGVASVWQIFRAASWFPVRRKARILRPSLRQVSWLRRWFATPLTELATPVARVGWQRIWSPVENVTLRVGGPRTGKSGEMACRILDAPGAVIATSTRTDLVDLTSQLRSRKGPIYIFNPSGLGNRASTITFDPLSGCSDPKTAVSRAADLVSGVSAPGASGGDREFWSAQAQRVLASLLHAAALGGGSMRDVLTWVSNPDDGAADVARFLRRSPQPTFEQDAAQFFGTNDRTRSSIMTTVMPALGWLSDSTAAEAASDGDFDVAKLLRERGTVYMLGAEDGQVAPLMAALTGHIAREARRIAATMPGGRLDPPLTLVLDEAALICPVPLDNWTADMGGRNVTIHIAVQSRAQLRQRWGDMGAAAIMNNAATLMIFGGSRDTEDLMSYSTLIGDRHEKLPTFDVDDQEVGATLHRVPIQSAAEIAQLPFRRVIVIQRGMRPAIGRIQVAWKRMDVRAAQFSARMAERAERWAIQRERVVLIAVSLLEALNRRLDAVNGRRAARHTPSVETPMPLAGPVESDVPTEVELPTAEVEVPTARTGNEPMSEFEAEFAETGDPAERDGDDGRWS